MLEPDIYSLKILKPRFGRKVSAFLDVAVYCFCFPNEMLSPY